MSVSSISELTNLDSLSYQELQELQDECRQANLSTSGNKMKLKQRLRGFLIMSSQNRQEAEGGDLNPQLAKLNQKSPSDDLICPITHDLPFDPVTAEDGRVYERSAILKHFKRNPKGVKSPVTNKHMGRRLLPAVQTKSLIETLIDNQKIQGDLAKAWLIKHHERKNFKAFTKSPSDDLICPITHDLPFDPVTAEDGRVYEHSAILEHFKCNPIRLKSPVTNEHIGRRLLPAVQTKCLIETLIENQTLQGDLAEAWLKKWLKKHKERKKFEALTKKAYDGDAISMFNVGMLYYHGKEGWTKDPELAYSWLKKAADKGHIEGLAVAGHFLVNGYGVGKNSTLGVAFGAMAAEGGSDLACCNMGFYFADGLHGLPVDIAQAKRFLQKGTNGVCSYLQASNMIKDQSRSKLQEL